MGKTSKGSYTFLISRKEYILCTISSLQSSQSSRLCTAKPHTDPHRIAIKLSRPAEPTIQNTLLILFNSPPEQFTIISHNWIELQHVIQDIYSDNTSHDLHSEALAQKITRVDLSLFFHLDFCSGWHVNSAVL